MSKPMTAVSQDGRERTAPYVEFVGFANSRNYDFMRLWQEQRIFMNKARNRMFMIRVRNGRVRLDDWKEFDSFSRFE